MSNTYFEFKEFTVNQDKSAMKVGMDSVLFGAWLNPGNAKSILDVGTGTGIIALMIAQKCDAKIDAIDIDQAAVEQANANFKNSKWTKRLMAASYSLQDYSQKSNLQYDLIVSNPPYFTNGQVAKEETRAMARHNISLTIDEFVLYSLGLLNSNGSLALVLPAELRRELVSAIAKYNLWIELETKVQPAYGKPYSRILFQISRLNKGKRKLTSLTIETDKRHSYTEEFTALARPYYMFMP